jgi:hypothetical protein
MQNKGLRISLQFSVMSSVSTANLLLRSQRKIHILYVCMCACVRTTSCKAVHYGFAGPTQHSSTVNAYINVELQTLTASILAGYSLVFQQTCVCYIVSRLVKPVVILVDKALLNTIQSSIVLLLWNSLLLLIFAKCQFRNSVHRPSFFTTN